jgi:hypothetical protein
MALHGLVYEHLYKQAPAADWFMLSHMIRQARRETSVFAGSSAVAPKAEACIRIGVWYY